MRAVLVAVVLLLSLGASSDALADQTISVTESISPTTAPPGGSVTVTFSATNTAGGDQTPFSLVLSLGQHWTVGDAPAGCSKPDAWDIDCEFASLAAGASTPTFSTTLTVDADALPGWILNARVFAFPGGTSGGSIGGDAKGIQVSAPTGGGSGGGGGSPPPPPPPPTLSVALHGAGTGSVTSSPGGIACGGACAATFPAGGTVTLTATPAAGSVFAGWGDGCASAATSLQCTVTLATNAAVTASFDLAPPPPPPLPPPPPNGCTVPSLHGLTLAAAASRLTKAHCRLGRVTRRASRAAVAGRVLSQQPAAGGRGAAGAKVAVVVGRRR